MTEGIESLGRIRAKGLALLAVTFLVGALAGVAGERALTWRRAPEFEPPPRPAFWPGRPGRLPPFLGQLELTEEQRTEITRILARWQPRTDSLFRASMLPLRAARDSVSAEIRAVLTPEQRAQLDAAMEDMRERRASWRRRFRGGPPDAERPPFPDPR